MPRNITVTFADGSSHVYQNAPDNLTPEQVTTRAQQDFGKQVSALDGGRSAAPAARPNRQVATPQVSPQQRDRARRALAAGEDTFRKGIAKMPADQQTAAWEQFYNRPKVRKFRTMAGLPETRTREEEIQQFARRNVNREISGRSGNRSGGLGFMKALESGAARMMFGIPERIEAAGRQYLPDTQSDNYAVKRGKNYSETLDLVRAENELKRGENTTGNILGTIGGALSGGSLATKAVQRGAGALAASGVPVVERAGNILQGLTKLKEGQQVRNTLKVATAGASGGAAQALGEGSDVKEGAAIGAVAPVAIGGTIKAARGVGKIARTVLRPFSGNTEKAIKEVVTEAPEAIAARQAELTRRTGQNVPVVAALKERDFKNVTERVLKRSDEATEIAKKHTAGHIRGFMDNMLRHVNNAGRTGDALPTTLDDLNRLRRDTADDLMQPIGEKTVDLTQLPLDDLERKMTREIGGRIRGLAPRINEALKDLDPGDLKDMGVSAEDLSAARRLMTDWGLGQPVQASVREMDALRRSLDAAGKASAASNPANSLAYRNAAKTIRDFVEREVPAYGQMVDTYAAQSRMIEGFETAASGKRISDIGDVKLSDNLRTPEGRIGMKAGELHRLREAATEKPTKTIALARDLAAQGKLTRPASLAEGAAQPGTVTENLGDRAAAGLADAADAESQVLGRMLDTEKVNALAQNEGGALSPEEIVYGAFLGNALASTKARFLAGLLDKLPQGFSKPVANNLAEMLFSRDAVQTEKAMRALERTGFGRDAVTALMRNALPESVAAGQLAAGGAEGAAVPPANAETGAGVLDYFDNPDDVSGDVPPADAQNPETGDYTAELQQIYDTEDPNLLDLVDRVQQQESGGQQFDESGQPLQSSAGAIGVMQVMPATAPEAAQLAGVPYDENAYRNDPNYNKLLGIAYLSEMLRRFDGDVEKAVAAYNAGPGAVEDAVDRDGRNWLAYLPEETQNYVVSVS